MSKHKKKPAKKVAKKAPRKTRRDVAEIARENLEQIIGEKLNGDPLPEPEPDTRNPAAVALSKLGASKGGKARAKKLSKTRRKEIAKKAARKRWGKDE